MTETEIIGCEKISDPIEQDFRKKNQWFSFTGALYGALGGAAFIGLLTTIVNALVKLSMDGPVAKEALGFFGVPPLLVMGGLMAVGTVCIWMSQREYTELKCIGDEHLALSHAKQNALQKSLEQAQTLQQEHPQNCRADGKAWAQVARQESQLLVRNQV